MYLKSRTLSLFLALAAAAALMTTAGCLSYTTGHTATPVEKGKAELTGRVGYYGAAAATGGVLGSGGIPTNLEFAGRFGLSENVDMGFKVFPIGFGGDVNIAAVNSDAFALSINPSVSYVGLPSIGVGNGGRVGGSYGTALVNVLADVVKTDSFTLTAGLKPGLLYAFGTITNAFHAGTRFVMGGTLLARFDINESLALTPSLDLLSPVGIPNGSIIFTSAMFGVNIKL